MTVSIWTLISTMTKATILEWGLKLAAAGGLPVTSWRIGDPTPAEYDFLAEVLASREEVTAEIIKSGFLSQAKGDWLTVYASEVFGVDREEATYANSTVTLANGGGGYYSLDAGDLTFKSSVTNKTYHSTSAISLIPGASDTVEVVADEPGSASSAGVDEIDDLVTTLLGVLVTGSTAAVGIDEQSDPSLREECAATLGALSPNGPTDAHRSVALNSDLTGVTEITRAQAVDDPYETPGTGHVRVYLASSSGGVSAGAVTAANDAIEQWSTPLGITPTVVSSTPIPVNITLTVSGDDVPSNLQDVVEAVLGVLIFALPINGMISKSAIVAAVHGAVIAAGASNVAVELVSPVNDVDIADTGGVITPGTIIATEV